MDIMRELEELGTELTLERYGKLGLPAMRHPRRG